MLPTLCHASKYSLYNYFLALKYIMPPAPRRMRKMRKARRVPRGKVVRRRAIPKAMAKSYSYIFQPNDQWIASTNNSTPGDVAIVPLASPLANSAFLSPIPSQSGFQFYYDMGVGLSFRLNDLGNIVNFTRIYQEYKINSIQVKITYLTTDASIQGAGLLPTLNYVMDTSDSSAPQTLQDVQSKAGAKTLRVSSQRNVLNLNIKPYQRLNTAINPTASSDFPAKIVRAGWNSCVSTDVTHFAGKFWFQNMYLPTTASTNTAVQFEYKYNVSFRGAKNLF